ncbi:MULTISPECIES: hypothetical protein [unclassified Vreelandella]
MNCIELNQQADRIASTFSKQELAKLVLALKSQGESLQQAVEVLDTIDTRAGYSMEQAWEEVLAQDSQLIVEDEE